jgi:hypothetical protein
MASPTQMHNVLCRSVTIEARFTASSRSIGIGPISTGPVTAESERCGGRCMYRMASFECYVLVRHGPIRQLPCRQLFLSRSMPSLFLRIWVTFLFSKLDNCCGNGMYVCLKYHECVSPVFRTGSGGRTMPPWSHREWQLCIDWRIVPFITTSTTYRLWICRARAFLSSCRTIVATRLVQI